MQPPPAKELEIHTLTLCFKLGTDKCIQKSQEYMGSRKEEEGIPAKKSSLLYNTVIYLNLCGGKNVFLFKYSQDVPTF